MNFILVRPYDNKHIVGLIAVQHPKKTLAMFQRNWDDAINTLKKASGPLGEEWCMDDVFHLMEGNGWTIMILDPMTVEY